MTYPTIDTFIGNTPLIRLQRLTGQTSNTILVKLEGNNPAGSVKDRPAYNMILQAELRGDIKPGDTLIEATSGNTGIGLAMVAAVKGYRLILVMPESMSIERRRIMLAYGAEFELTPKGAGMKGAIARAQEIVSKIDGAWMPQQFQNPANVAVHRLTTAPEILADFDDGLDYLVTGVGTGGHITGCVDVLKKQWPWLKVHAVEPALSPVLSGGEPGPHPLQGIGAGFKPDVLNTELLDGVLRVEADHAKDMARRAAREEGMLIGLSSGATLAAIDNAIKSGLMDEGSRILGFCYDTGERYLSVPDFLPEE